MGWCEAPRVGAYRQLYQTRLSPYSYAAEIGTIAPAQTAGKETGSDSLTDLYGPGAAILQKCQVSSFPGVPPPPWERWPWILQNRRSRCQC